MQFKYDSACFETKFWSSHSLPLPNHLWSPTRANENIEPNEPLAYFQNKFSKNICFAINNKHLLCLCGTVFGKLDENEFLFLVNWKLTTLPILTRKCNEVCFIEALAVEECYEGLYGGIWCRNVGVWGTQARGFRIPPSQRQLPTRTTTLLQLWKNIKKYFAKQISKQPPKKAVVSCLLARWNLERTGPERRHKRLFEGTLVRAWLWSHQSRRILWPNCCLVLISFRSLLSRYRPARSTRHSPVKTRNCIATFT